MLRNSLRDSPVGAQVHRYLSRQRLWPRCKRHLLAHDFLLAMLGGTRWLQMRRRMAKARR